MNYLTGTTKKRTQHEHHEKSENQIIPASKPNTLDFDLQTPKIKSRRLSYRDPQPLASLEFLESISGTLNSPSTCDSLGSEHGGWPLPNSALSSPTTVTSPLSGDSLGSLDNLIKHTNLESLKTCVLPANDSTYLISPKEQDVINNNLILQEKILQPLSNHDLCHPEVSVKSANQLSCDEISGVSSAQHEHLNEKNKKICLENKDVINKNYSNNNNFSDSLYELQESHEANTDLAKCNTCFKNPGHQAFFSLSELMVKNLPLEIQHEDSLTFFNCVAQLVVQISVTSTSAARGHDDSYSKYIGTNRRRNGSGFIANVDDHFMKFRCRRDDCPLTTVGEEALNVNENSTSPPTRQCLRNSSNMSTSSTSSSAEEGSYKHFFYSGVYIHTNKHIIFDKSEADNATVKFFFDTPDEKKVVYGHVAAIVGVNDSQDHVTLHVMSHDKDLFNTLGILIKNVKSSYNQMVKSTHKTQQVHGKKHQHSWVAIISHAHGMSRSITLGRIKKEVLDGTRVIKYYDAATCPESSGGLVMTPSLLRLQWPGAVHSAFDPDTGLNVTMDSRFPDLNVQDMGRINESLVKRKDSADNLLNL
ncbi:unnamed protein product [Lymnaea stagnalis]|uniref:Uncharacterized protein n=1 Tax=Lymnaea stagnalis TaxID=6523 RepID=A0AAV2HQF2_LYMST